MKRALGLGLLLVAVALMGYGVHTVISNGNCSSTGYVQYGPVPKCSHGSEFLAISGLFFLGPALLVAGWGFLKIKGVTWPAVLAGIGIGALTIRSDTGVAAGAKNTGFGIALACAALIVISAAFSGRRLMRRGSSPPAHNGSIAKPGPTAPPAHAHPPAVAAAPPGVAGDGDAITKIARLARLRDDGALTEAEFEQQKAKLLDEV